MYSLSPENDGAQTRISWSFSGPIKDSSVLSTTDWGGGIGADFKDAFNSSYFTASSLEFFPVTGAGSFNRLSTASSVQIKQIAILASGSSRYIAIWATEIGDGFVTEIGDGGLISYTAGTDSYVIGVPFTAFNAGTWTVTNDYYLQGGDMSFTATIVPEPSALSLLAVGLGVVLRRRRRTV